VQEIKNANDERGVFVAKRIKYRSNGDKLTPT